ncbi:hypothetical protein BT69DRAFT_1282993 [Atractiella rhizophila]|nr:hypothetical protein BT69DRAFT_1282993 [Atractiella rhizophila]
MDNLVSDVSMIRRLKCGRRSYTRALLQKLPDGLEMLELEATKETGEMVAEELIQRGKKEIKEIALVRGDKGPLRDVRKEFRLERLETVCAMLDVRFVILGHPTFPR